MHFSSKKYELPRPLGYGLVASCRVLVMRMTQVQNPGGISHDNAATHVIPKYEVGLA